VVWSTIDAYIKVICPWSCGSRTGDPGGSAHDTKSSELVKSVAYLGRLNRSHVFDIVILLYLVYSNLEKLKPLETAKSFEHPALCAATTASIRMIPESCKLL
jgi:hypothetical protein